MVRVAALDIGGNDIKLVIKDVDEDSGGMKTILPLTPFPTALRMAVSSTGDLIEDKYKKTQDALEGIGGILKDKSVEAVHAVTCSAGRMMNGSALDRLRKDVKENTTGDLDVFTGPQEAQAGYKAALNAYKSKVLDGLYDTPRENTRFITADVGGGSTEIAYGIIDGDPMDFVSTPIGGNSLKQLCEDSHDFDEVFNKLLPMVSNIHDFVFDHEKYAHEIGVDYDPDDYFELKALFDSRKDRTDALAGDELARKAIEVLESANGVESIRESAFDGIAKHAADTKVIVLGGAATTFSAFVNSIRSLDADAGDGKIIHYGTVMEKAREFFALDDKGRLDTGCVIPGRETSIHYSVLIIAAMLTVLGEQDMVVSAAGIVDSLF